MSVKSVHPPAVDRASEFQGTVWQDDLPVELFLRRPSRFVTKILFALLIITFCIATIHAGQNRYVDAASVVVLGLMYAHLLELQHECLHEHAFRSSAMNRAFGILGGLFLLSSYSHYQFEHLRHHRYFGRAQGAEFFDHPVQDLDNWWGFFRAAMSLRRYRQVLTDVWTSSTGRPVLRADDASVVRRVRTEYQWMAVSLLAAVAFTLVTGDFTIFFAWVLPALLVSEPAHFLIELPEHFGLNTQTNDDGFTNTRTVVGSPLSRWYTNFNNLHTAHHLAPTVPLAHIRQLTAMSADRLVVVERSYWSFYRAVFRGDLRPDRD